MTALLAAFVEDIRVYRGPDLYTDHHLDLSKICLSERPKNATLKKDENADEVYKIH